MALLLLTPVRESGARQFSEAIYDDIKPSIVRISCSAVDRAATGFVWSNADTAVTAMHVVTGCGNVTVHYEAQKISRPAKVARVLGRADLALLKISDPPRSSPLEIDTTPPPLNQSLSTLGYPLQTINMSSTSLQLRYGAKTLGEILPQQLADKLSGGSPSLDLEIDNIEGHLLPGHSGAPIFNQQRRVVAVADGGLENGAVAVSWAIPAKFLTRLSASTENLPAVTAHAGNAVLFAAEGEAKDRGQTTCSGQTLVNLRSVSFTTASATADDPRGLMQLVQNFGVDPSPFMFDVYQHLASGATFVLPAGARLEQAPNGDCVAVLPSGKVELHLELGILASVLEAQTKSQLFEQMIAGREPQQWVADQKWTYQMPVPRFDGMIMRRRAYGHIRLVPYPFQDRYGFETLAVRRNVFIGFAAIYSWSPQFQQQFKACLLSPAASYCNDARTFAADWVKAALGIQLTTFPIG